MSKTSKPTGRLSGVRWETAVDGAISLSGSTFTFKETIKTLGGRWAPETKTWTLPAGTSLEFLVPPPPPKPKAREDWTLAEWQTYCANWPRRRGNIDRCCSHAVAFTQYDYQGPTCYDCPRHGKTYNSYCGD